jgi:hypothetical protein
LLAPEKFSLFALLFLTISSNLDGRGEKLHIHLKKGLYNISLFITSAVVSYLVANHVMLGAETSTVYQYCSSNKGDECISNGGKALWFMMILVDYTSFMFTCTFALFYFDDLRKRVSKAYWFLLLHHGDWQPCSCIVY